ncbi:MAG: MBL fold metallo-hydrolase [Acidobacteria bacterium]|nr:MBL fold metallo-hydrolase [Acidobacteriota bacterium]
MSSKLSFRSALFILALLATEPLIPAQSQPFHFDPSDPRESVPDDGPKPPFVSSARRLLTAPELKDAPDDWISNSLDWVNFILTHYQPALVEAPVRRAAMIRLDDVLHIESAPRKPIVQQYYKARLEAALREIETTRVPTGLRIWKLYNHGFFVRTASVSIAFDIVPGTREPGFAMPQEWIERLAAQADVLFISHQHGDHANPAVARAFLALRKPVVVPDDVWTAEPTLAKAVTRLSRNTGPAQTLPLANGRNLTVVPYPGHQGPRILVNVTLVTTPEGFTIVQTGDQSGSEAPGSDFDWLAQIGRDHKVDILMPNCWANGLGRMVRGVNPALVITGHENEMGHKVDHREDYTQTYTRLFPIRYPAIVMTWGESFHYQRPVR